MNILFFLKPKSEVAFIYDYCTLRQVLETMEYHKYASIPMLNREGEYVGTITEGDLLWGIKSYQNMDLKRAENIFIQDFVPVVDDQKKFIGIITRKTIIEYCYERMQEMESE